MYKLVSKITVKNNQKEEPKLKNNKKTKDKIDDEKNKKEENGRNQRIS